MARGLLTRGLRRVAALGSGLVLALIAAEVLVRVVAPAQLAVDSLRWASHPDVGYRLRPNVVMPGPLGGPINSVGLRGPEPGPKPAGTHRTVVLGDSFVFGAGVKPSEAVSAQLAELRPTYRGRPTQFVNAGTPSYGSVRQLHWLETFGERLQPDSVLLGFYVGNDVTDNIETDELAVVAGRLVRAKDAVEPSFKVRLRLLLGESHLWRLITRRFGLGERRRDSPRPDAATASPATDGVDGAVGADGAQSEQDAERLKRKRARERARFVEEQSKRLWVYARPEVEAEVIRDAYASTLESLDGMLAWCAEREIEFSVALIPDRIQVDAELMLEAMHAAGARAELGDLTRPQMAIGRWCVSNDVPCVDLLPEMKLAEADPDFDSYLFGDSHWSADGHRRGAELIAAKLLPIE